MPNCYGMEEKWDAPKGGACGMPRREEKREEERAWGSPKVAWGCCLDALGTLGQVLLNRHED